MSKTSLDALAARPRETGEAGAGLPQSAHAAGRIGQPFSDVAAATASRREIRAGLAGFCVAASPP